MALQQCSFLRDKLLLLLGVVPLLLQLLLPFVLNLPELLQHLLLMALLQVYVGLQQPLLLLLKLLVLVLQLHALQLQQQKQCVSTCVNDGRAHTHTVLGAV